MSGNESVRYDSLGYDKDGFNSNGYNKDGYDKNGFDEDGFDEDGYNVHKWDKDGFNRVRLYSADWECCAKGNNDERHKVNGEDRPYASIVYCYDHNHGRCGWDKVNGCRELDDKGNERPRPVVILRIVISI